jgi:hypothetical protein
MVVEGIRGLLGVPVTPDEFHGVQRLARAFRGVCTAIGRKRVLDALFIAGLIVVPTAEGGLARILGDGPIAKVGNCVAR